MKLNSPHRKKFNAGFRARVVEAMKMQNELAAPASGRVRVVNFKAGDQVGAGAAIIELETGAR